MRPYEKKLVPIVVVIALLLILIISLFIFGRNKDLSESPQQNEDTASIAVIDATESLYEEKIVEEVVSSDDEYLNNRKFTFFNSDTIVGDFNGDGKKEEVYFISDTVFYEGEEATSWDFQGAYTSVFSDKSIPNFETTANWVGPLHNLGDLNGDGRDEIGIYISYFSAWGAYEVLYFNGTEWVDLIGSYPLHSEVFLEKGRDFHPVEKYSNKKVKIYISARDEEGWHSLETKIVEVKLLEKNKGLWK